MGFSRTHAPGRAGSTAQLCESPTSQRFGTALLSPLRRPNDGTAGALSEGSGRLRRAPEATGKPESVSSAVRPPAPGNDDCARENRRGNRRGQGASKRKAQGQAQSQPESRSMNCSHGRGASRAESRSRLASRARGCCESRTASSPVERSAEVDSFFFHTFCFFFPRPCVQTAQAGIPCSFRTWFPNAASLSRGRQQTSSRIPLPSPPCDLSSCIWL